MTVAQTKAKELIEQVKADPIKLDEDQVIKCAIIVCDKVMCALVTHGAKWHLYALLKM